MILGVVLLTDVMLSVITLSVTLLNVVTLTNCHYAESHFDTCLLHRMPLFVILNNVELSVIILCLSVVMLRVFIPSAIMVNVYIAIIQSVIAVNVVAPCEGLAWR